jgi:hypothetical protein
MTGTVAQWLASLQTFVGTHEEDRLAVRAGAVASTLTADLLEGPVQRLRVAHRSRTAWQLAHPETGRVLVCLATAQALRLPHAVVVPDLPQPDLPQPDVPVRLGERCVTVGDQVLAVGRWFEPARPRLPGLRARLRCDDEIARLHQSLPGQIGRGEGLTPYHDDVLCGALVTLHAAGDPWSGRLGTAVTALPLEALTSATSAALLRLAARGFCIDELSGWLTAVASGADPGPAAARVAAVGHTSGRGLLDGASRVVHLDPGSAAA